MNWTNIDVDIQPKDDYFAGYRAFEQGDYAEAIDLASRVLTTADAHSYWYWGALGLRCWAANFAEDEAAVMRDAQLLIAAEESPEARWFQGVAHLNLGLLHRSSGAHALAQTHFLRACESYDLYQVQPDAPSSWEYVRRFFAGAARWAADESTESLKLLRDDITTADDTSDDEVAHLLRAIELYFQAATGNAVHELAVCALRDGVSRTFLSLLLI